MICFRADGNPQVGSGHVMRCLSLADAMRERGRHCVFVSADGHLVPAIQERGYDCVVLGTAYERMEAELPALLPRLDELAPGCLILDSYFATPGYMRALKAAAPLVYIDDLHAFDYPADIVVNYNLYAKGTAYGQAGQALLGPQYVPLRREFRGIARRAPRERVRDVLVSTGGSDPCHAACTLLAYLRGHPQGNGITYHVVVGAMNRDWEEIERIAAGLSCVELHRQVSDMRSLMLRCDMAVSAAGSTLYELCACGVPAVAYILADNQAQGAEAFDEAGLVPCAGDVRTDPRFAEHVFSKLEGLSGDWEARKRMAARMQVLVDGDGAERVADAVEAAAKRLPQGGKE